ncbi:aspartate/glutamate racemase family protein [Lutibacter flavus]|uniref:Aspartate racemase n=1 Tax=Lutibacter flavus TaxID=691689 RepID=A0A238YJD6_9FLAO|nr:aspartate/glutamate racemase family protein [Lutibacter flavus]SNR70519.1 aspartate racemase [Lutibacter flavus]
MKILGLIGGTSWVSTVDYYKLINQGINEQLGGNNFSECIIYSFNFQDIRNNLDKNDWNAILKMVVTACKKLEKSGAKGIVLCANTMHYIADKIQSEINIPIIHIATETAIEIKKSKLKKVALLGTRFTMEYDFFKSKLKEFGIEAIVPKNPEDINFMHSTILDELGKGIIKSKTKALYLSIIEELKHEGAEGVIAGCTEIPLIINQTDIDLPYFDTTLIHGKSAIEFALAE